MGHEYQFAISSCSSRRTRHKQKRSLAFNMVTRHICRDCLISVPHKFDLTNWYIFSENTQFPKLCCYGSMDRNTLNVVARDIHQDCLALLVNLPLVQCQWTASLCSKPEPTNCSVLAALRQTSFPYRRSAPHLLPWLRLLRRRHLPVRRSPASALNPSSVR